jgi:hypothetical protein
MRRIQLISLKKSLELAKGFEPSTPTLARLCSILRVLGRRIYNQTKTERPTTILLPNPVAADDTSRYITDKAVKIPR